MASYPAALEGTARGESPACLVPGEVSRRQSTCCPVCPAFLE